VTNTFALLRLLPMSERDKDIEILALGHQLLALQRQVGKPCPCRKPHPPWWEPVCRLPQILTWPDHVGP
jgi:hypothetical protein